MSLKIYNAYRLAKAQTLWDVVRDITVQGREAAQGVLRRIYVDMAAAVLPTHEIYQACLKSDWPETGARLEAASRTLQKLYKAASISFERNPFNFDISVGIWRNRGRYYLRGFCDMQVSHCLDFMEDDRRLIPYSYWDNSDRPKDVPISEWRARARTWHAINRETHNVHLLIDVLSYQNLFRVDPAVEMLREIWAGIQKPE